MLVTTILLILIGCLSGLVLSIIGAGFGLIGVPLLIYTLNLHIHDAILISIVSTSIVCVFHTIKTFKQKLIAWRYALPISIIGLVISPIGAKTSFTLNAQMLSLIYGALMILSAYLMWRNIKKTHIESEDKKNIKPYKYIMMIILAFISSFIGGMTGVGGGILTVPFLVLFMNLSMKSAAATTIFIIAALAGSGGIAHLILNANFLLTHALIYTTGGLLGILLGTKISLKFSEGKLKQLFAFIVSIAGTIIIIQNLIR